MALNDDRVDNGDRRFAKAAIELLKLADPLEEAKVFNTIVARRIVTCATQESIDVYVERFGEAEQRLCIRHEGSRLVTRDLRNPCSDSRGEIALCQSALFSQGT